MNRAALVLALAMMIVTACSGEYTGERDPPSEDAGNIVAQYVFNEDRADEIYEDRWFSVTAGPAVRVRDGSRVRFRYQGLNLEMHFKDKADVRDLNQGDHVTAVCKVQGWVGFAGRIYLNNCRRKTG